jgi:hypothetical protein
MPEVSHYVEENDHFVSASLQNNLEMFNSCIKGFKKENISSAEIKFITDALLVGVAACVTGIDNDYAILCINLLRVVSSWVLVCCM